MSRGRRTATMCYFVQNMHINPTNICVNRCKFCAFSRSKGEAGAYEMSIADILAKARTAGKGVRELHIVSGLHPDLPFEWYLEMLRALKKEFPKLHLKAFTAVEIDYLARISRTEPQGDAAAAEGGRARFPSRRRRGDLRCSGPEHALRREDQRRPLARSDRDSAQASGSNRTLPCSTAISKPRNTGSTIFSSSGSSRTGRTASRPSFRSVSIPRTPR